jgi:hypothetical protein
MHDANRETAAGAFLDGDQQLVLGGQAAHQVFVLRFGEAGIGDGRRQPPRHQVFGRLVDTLETRPEGQDDYR